MLRAVLLLPVIGLSVAAFGLGGIVLAAFDGGHGASERLIVLWGRFVLQALGIDVVVSGASHRPQGPAVYAANHGSALDIPILFAHMPVAFRIIHKRSLYLVPIVGAYLRLSGHIGIDRSNPFRARKSLERAAERIRSGTSVVVFPEGTRSVEAEVQPFKRGSFVLALTAGVPVVPVSLAGVKNVVPRGIRGMRPGTIHLILHPPVSTEGRSTEEAAALAEEVRAIVARGCAEAA